MATSNALRGKLERAIVRVLIRELATAGYVPRAVWDGGEYVPVATTAQTIAAVFAVDEATIHFGPVADPEEWGSTGVFLVLGEGQEIICDWHAGPPAFSDAVQRACDRIDQGVVTIERE